MILKLSTSAEAQSVLHQLLDKYEASSAFVRGQTTARRVQVNITDLVYGGILILQALRDTAWPEAVPWRMEPERLEEYAQYLEPFTEDYRHKLAQLLEQDEYGWARPLVQGLLHTGGTLEQEAFLV